MTLQEQFEKSGQWLFRWRSYIPLIGLAMALLALRESNNIGHSESLRLLWGAVCLGVSFFGLGIRSFTIGHTPKNTSGRNTTCQVADSLNTTGIYSIVRNPLYLGNFFMFLGIALFPQVWWSTVIFTLLFWLYYERIIFAEEAYLREKFGDAYEAWAESTPAFIPRFRNYKLPSLPFSLKNVLRREYNGFFAVVVCLFFLESLSDLFKFNRFELNMQWLVALGVAFTIWFILRTLKKKTRILDVVGR